jgi:serine/threonine protein kinase
VLRNGKVLVKKLDQSREMNEERFDNEVRCLMRMRANHKNIVRFLGFCADRQHEGNVEADELHRLLCFEYPTGGTLDAYITGRRIVSHDT